jgi:hypothetical protein
VPWTEGKVFSHHWPGARFLLTEGLGHSRRILRDDGIVRVVAGFIAGRSAVASLALPFIAYPAPLY